MLPLCARHPLALVAGPYVGTPISHTPPQLSHPSQNAAWLSVSNVSGRFTRRQRTIYDTVLAAQEAALAAAKPGVLVKDVHQAATDVIAKAGFAPYFFHGTSHYLGIEAHDAGSYDLPLEPGDVVLIRTGVLRYWGEAGENHAKLAEHDSAGLTLEGAKWLVEQKGAVMIGGDTSGLEVGVDPALPGVSIPVHLYLLVEQGVHIGEFHYLEELARSKVYRFTYVAVTNRVKGAVAGFAMRPLAIE